MKLALVILLLLVSVAYAEPPGIYFRTNCDSIITPTTEGTLCYQMTTASGRTAGHTYSRISSAWVDITGNGTILGSIASGQVAVGSAANTVAGSSTITASQSATTPFLAVIGSSSASISIDSGTEWALTTSDAVSNAFRIFNNGLATHALSIAVADNNATFTANVGITGLTASRPVYSDASKVLTSGTFSGNTTTFATASGTLTSGDCVKIDANGNFVANGSACAGSGAASADLQTFTSTGANTWNKPTGAKTVYVIICGAGGSGGGGSCAATNALAAGGGGGGGAVCRRVWFLASELGSSETVTIGTGQAGGSGVSCSAGGDGATGGNSTFGTKLTAFGGGGGAGNVAGTGGGSGAGFDGQGGGQINQNGNVGGACIGANLASGTTNSYDCRGAPSQSASTGATTGNNSHFTGASGGPAASDGGGCGTGGHSGQSAGGAGSGGGVTTANAPEDGCIGGGSYWTGTLVTGGTVGATASACGSGGAGGAGADATTIAGPTGGGGGASKAGAGTTGCNGGDGGAGGGGGGGGGGSNGAGSTGGNGGRGGHGKAWVWTYF